MCVLLLLLILCSIIIALVIIVIEFFMKAYNYIQTARVSKVLFNDTLNTFYLRLCGISHMVKDHSDIEKGNPLLAHRLLFSISSKEHFICTIPQTG